MHTYIKEYFVGNEAHHLQAVVHHLFPQLQEKKKRFNYHRFGYFHRQVLHTQRIRWILLMDRGY